LKSEGSKLLQLAFSYRLLDFLTPDTSPVKFVIAAHDARDSLRVKAMLFKKNTRGERLFRIVFINGDRLLLYDWSTVQRLVHKMHCAAGPLDPMLKRLPLRVKAGEGWQQARMNIEYTPAKSLYETTGEQAHITRQADQFDPSLADGSDHLTLALLARAPASFNQESFDAALLCAQQPSRSPLVAQDQRNLSAWNTPVLHGISERQHVRPAS
jgi:hypothetical protein